MGATFRKNKQNATEEQNQSAEKLERMRTKKEAKQGKTEAKKTSRMIDSTLRRERMQKLGHQRFLVLGPPDSGKGTVIKNLTLFHDRMTCTGKQRNIENDNENYDSVSSSKYHQLSTTSCNNNNDYKDLIRHLWCDDDDDDDMAQEITANHLLNLLMGCKSDPRPVMLTTTTTTKEGGRHHSRGEPETFFQVRGQSFSLVESGQRSKRYDKWLGMFSDEVSAIMFVVDCSTFHPRTKLLHEAHASLKNTLNLFANIWADTAFGSTPIMLLLNKEDKLYTNIRTNGPDRLEADILAFRPYFLPTVYEYTGSDEFDKAKHFIMGLFVAIVTKKLSKRRRGYCHMYFTNSVDPDGLTHVLNDYRNVHQRHVLSQYELL